VRTFDTFFLSVTVDAIFVNCAYFASTLSRIALNRSNVKSMHQSRLNIENNVDSVIVKHTLSDSRRTSVALLIVQNRTVGGPTLIEFEISLQ